MKYCTFFGHRDSPPALEAKLEAVLRNLIEHQDVQHFYVGEQGRYDEMVWRTLLCLQKEYAQIAIEIVLAYFPKEKKGTNTLLPDGIENVPPRFALDWRNRWMVNRADYVVCYVCRGFGGAAKYMELAMRKGKRVINLWEKE